MMDSKRHPQASRPKKIPARISKKSAVWKVLESKNSDVTKAMAVPESLRAQPSGCVNMTDIIDTSYQEILVDVLLNQIAIPKFNNECFDPGHYDYIAGLLRNGYIHTRGVVVVYANPEYFKNGLKETGITDLTRRTDFDGVLIPVEGIYRTLFLHRNMDCTSQVRVAVVQWKDKKPMSLSER